MASLMRLSRGMSIFRHFSGTGAGAGAGAEQEIAKILTDKLQPTKLNVKDTSGGCGSMYDIQIESPLFQVQSLVSLSTQSIRHLCRILTHTFFYGHTEQELGSATQNGYSSN